MVETCKLLFPDFWCFHASDWSEMKISHRYLHSCSNFSHMINSWRRPWEVSSASSTKTSLFSSALTAIQLVMAHAVPFAVFVLLCAVQLGDCQKTSTTPPVTKDKDRHGCEVRDASSFRSNISFLRKKGIRKASCVYFAKPIGNAMFLSDHLYICTIKWNLSSETNHLRTIRLFYMQGQSR